MKNNSGKANETNYNELSELEAQLRFWTPRRPSARIEGRLFGRRRLTTPDGTAVPFGWFAPVTAALLLACIVFNQHAGTASARATNAPLVAMIISNSSSAAYLPGSFQHDQNIITANTFEWTNGPRSTSSIRSLSGPRGKTFQ